MNVHRRNWYHSYSRVNQERSIEPGVIIKKN